MTPAKHYTISELAAEFDVTTRTIRFYEEKGLLTPERRGTSRLFSPADRVKLKLILRGKRLGLSLEEGREIIEMYDPEHGNVDQLQKLIDKIREKKQFLENQLLDMETMLGDLRSWESQTLAALTQAKRADKKA
jgi:DNA-binding transcriptional MerR regulator